MMNNILKTQNFEFHIQRIKVKPITVHKCEQYVDESRLIVVSRLWSRKNMIEYNFYTLSFHEQVLMKQNFQLKWKTVEEIFQKCSTTGLTKILLNVQLEGNHFHYLKLYVCIGMSNSLRMTLFRYVRITDLINWTGSQK